MPKVTFEVPPDLKAKMDAHPEINWSAFLRQAIEQQAHVAEIARQIAAEMADPRIQAVAAKLKKGVGRRYRA